MKIEQKEQKVLSKCQLIKALEKQHFMQIQPQLKETFEAHKFDKTNKVKVGKKWIKVK